MAYEKKLVLLVFLNERQCYKRRSVGVLCLGLQHLSFIHGCNIIFSATVGAGASCISRRVSRPLSLFLLPPLYASCRRINTCCYPKTACCLLLGCWDVWFVAHKTVRYTLCYDYTHHCIHILIFPQNAEQFIQTLRRFVSCC